MKVIYRLTSPSGAVYIGQTKNLKNRLAAYRSLRCKAQGRLYKSLAQHGFDSHAVAVLHTFSRLEEQSVVDDYERYVIAVHRHAMRCEMLNITDGGRGNAHGFWGKRGSRLDISGESHRSAKLTAEDVRDIRALYIKGQRWCGLRQLARHYGVHIRAVRNVVQGVSWKHLPAGGSRDVSVLRQRLEREGRDYLSERWRIRYGTKSTVNTKEEIGADI